MYFTTPEALWNTQSKNLTRQTSLLIFHDLLQNMNDSLRGGGEILKMSFQVSRKLTNTPTSTVLNNFEYLFLLWYSMNIPLFHNSGKKTVLLLSCFYFFSVKDSSSSLKTNKNIMIILWTLTDQKFQNSEIKPSVGYLIVSIIL